MCPVILVHVCSYFSPSCSEWCSTLSLNTSPRATSGRGGRAGRKVEAEPVEV